jgi:hypothetical protein
VAGFFMRGRLAGMSKRKPDPNLERRLAALKKYLAAQTRITESLKQRSPGCDMVVRLMDAEYEASLAKAEWLKQLVADTEEMLRRQ